MRRFKKPIGWKNMEKKKVVGFWSLKLMGFFNSVNTHDHSITIGIHWYGVYEYMSKYTGWACEWNEP